MQQIKIREDLWKAIVEGKKTFEFRKLSKGLSTGTYEFISIDKIACAICGGAEGGDCNYKHDDGSLVSSFTHKVFGSAKLTPILVNPRMLKLTLCQNENCQTDNCDYCKCETKNFKDVDWAFLSREQEEDYQLESEDDFQAFEEARQTSIDEASYSFVLENYVKPKIDFVVYKVEDVLETNHE